MLIKKEERGTGMDFDRKERQEQKKKTYLLILFIVLCLEIAGGIFLWKMPVRQDKNAVNFKKAQEGDFTSVRLMMLSDNLGQYILGGPEDFYFCFNQRDAAVVKIAKSRVSEYQEFIDYYNGISESFPESVKLYGIAAKADEKLKETVIQAVNDMVQENYTVEDYELLFQPYYLDTQYQSVPVWVFWLTIAGMAAGAVLFVVFLVKLSGTRQEMKEEDLLGRRTAAAKGFGTAESFGTAENAAETELKKAVPETKLNWWLAIPGAVLGAVLGGAVWMLLRLWGYRSFLLTFGVYLVTWVGFYFAGRKAKMKRGAWIAVILIGTIALFSANYAAWAWEWYQSGIGPDSLWTAFLQTGRYLTEHWYWKTFFRQYISIEIVIVFIAAAGLIRTKFK